MSPQLQKLNESEIQRLTALKEFEKTFRHSDIQRVAGVDEAGRGPLAGPVVAAACSIPDHLLIPGINDSKKISPKLRAHLFDTLTTHPEVTHGVGIVSSEEIDKVNILEATKVAMQQALQNLPEKPDLLLVDGLHLNVEGIRTEKIIKGDSLSYLIAAASIIAKETRDRLMDAYHEKWPQYGFNTNRGYGTRTHLEALSTHGPCPIHRFTFEPVKAVFSAF